MEPSTLGIIVVTEADSHVGRALLRHLKPLRARTVALTGGPATLAASEVIPDWVNSDAATRAIRGADFVIHLNGTPFRAAGDTYWSKYGETADALAFALAPSRLRRVLFLSSIGSDEASSNRYLRLKARAERVICETGKPLVVFRCGHVVGSPDDPGPTAAALQTRYRNKVEMIGDGRQRVAPVFVDDVVSALLAGLVRGALGIYDLTGPEVLTLDDLARLVNRNPEVPIAHYPPWLFRLRNPSLRGGLIDVMRQDSVGDPSRAIAEFGLQLTSLREVWRPRASQKLA